MGFKVDTSFLRYLTMGAAGTKKVIDILEAEGLRPIELERYSSSNKIWATKVKRLRLPDLLCVNTGLRIEVRAKSALAIKMSDAPENPDRRWFSGLRPNDLVAFIRCEEVDEAISPSESAEFFWVQDLLSTEALGTRLGPPKSASEGSERDREWPTTVPKQSGTVIAVTPAKIQTQLSSNRRQTYTVTGKTVYVSPGDRFEGNSQFIAGLPCRKVSISQLNRQPWDPRALANSDTPLDRYVAAKALSVVGNVSDIPLLTGLLGDVDKRVALEAAGSLARLGDIDGLNALIGGVLSPLESYLRIEAVFLLSELHNAPLHNEARDALFGVATNQALENDEARQAAIWGLGFAGHQDFGSLLNLLDASNEDERTHAVVAFGERVPVTIVSSLVAILADDSAGMIRKASAQEVLSNLVCTQHIVLELEALAINGSPPAKAWALATLGSMTPCLTDQFLTVQSVRVAIQPMQLLSPSQNWTKRETARDLLAFVSKQSVFSA